MSETAMGRRSRRAPWWTYATGASPIFAAAWLLLGGYRAGQGQWQVAFLDAFIAFDLLVIWRLHRIIDSPNNGSLEDGE